MRKINVYAKLQKARVTLQEMDLKKSGQNTFAGYDYFELGDFIPAINKIFSEVGIFSQVSFTSEQATLTIVNTDKPDEQIVFTSPMAEANLKGCHPIQNAGAVQSYQRRYLYMAALEIVEQDALDKTTGKDSSNATQGSYNRSNQHTNKQSSPTPQERTTQSEPPSGANDRKATENQVKLLRTKRKQAGLEGNDEISKFLGFDISSLTELPMSKVNDLIKFLDERKLPF